MKLKTSKRENHQTWVQHIFFLGAVCLVFATFCNWSLSFRMVFATFWHGTVRAFCVIFATFGHCHLPLGMVFARFWHFNRSFARYLLHFGTSNVHVGVLKTSLGCRLGFDLGFHFVFFLGYDLRFHLGFLSGFPGFHLGFNSCFHLRCFLV